MIISRHICQELFLIFYKVQGESYDSKIGPRSFVDFGGIQGNVPFRAADRKRFVRAQRKRAPEGARSSPGG
jgi:hypothetical protein